MGQFYVKINTMAASSSQHFESVLFDHGQQLDEAIRLVKRALELEPENPSYQDSLGWAYFRQGNAAEAQKHLGPAADKLPKNSVDNQLTTPNVDLQ